MVKRRLLLAAGVITALLAVSSLAVEEAIASRAPTTAERAAITRVERHEMSPQERQCVRVRVSVSTVNARFAFAEWRFPGACAKYAGNGADILKRKRGRWRHIFSGDFAGAPPCSKVPDKVSVDLWNHEHCQR